MILECAAWIQDFTAPNQVGSISVAAKVKKIDLCNHTSFYLAFKLWFVKSKYVLSHILLAICLYCIFLSCI